MSQASEGDDQGLVNRLIEQAAEKDGTLSKIRDAANGWIRSRNYEKTTLSALDVLVKIVKMCETDGSTMQ